MKKIMFIAALVAALTACTKPAERKTFHLTGFPDLSFSYQGGSALFGIEANADEAWTLVSDADWCTAVQGFGKGDGARGTGDASIFVICDRWTKNSVRKGTITVTGPGGAFTKTLTQEPKPVPDEPLQLGGNVPYSGGEAHVALPEGFWVSAISGTEWLSVVNCEEGKLTVQAGPNPNPDRERTAIVTVLLSDDTPLAEVKVTQKSEKIPAPVD